MTSASTSILPEIRLKVLNQLDLGVCNGCDGCGLRCTAGVPMTEDEFQSVQQFRHDSNQNASITEAEQQNKRFVLDEDVVVEICRFRNRESGMCSIYPARPLICRLMGHTEWMPCPIEAVPKFADTEDSVALMQAYAEHPRRTYEQWTASLNSGATE